MLHFSYCEVTDPWIRVTFPLHNENPRLLSVPGGAPPSPHLVQKLPRASKIRSRQVQPPQPAGSLRRLCEPEPPDSTSASAPTASRGCSRVSRLRHRYLSTPGSGPSTARGGLQTSPSGFHLAACVAARAQAPRVILDFLVATFRK